MWKDSETELDFLDYDYLIKALQDIILDDNLLPASIGVYGDWGSGKSSLMYMCKKRLEEQDPSIKCIVFNGWLFESYEDAKTAILGNILDEIGKSQTLSAKAIDILKGLLKSIDKFKLFKAIAKYGAQLLIGGGIGTIVGTTSQLTEKATAANSSVDYSSIGENVKNELNNKDLREDIRKFQDEFAELIEESKISRLVVFIDELDRCRPDTILATLEALKLFMFKGKVAFVIGADERHISYAVKSKFSDIEGIQIDIGKEYLEKLIQYPIRIPRLDAREVETYLACLLLQSELPPTEFEHFVALIKSSKSVDVINFKISEAAKEFKSESVNHSQITDSLSIAIQLSDVLSNGLRGNPRQCKRFLNTLYMRLSMAEYQGINLNRKILAKIMLLEYIKPSLFNEMAKMAFSNTLDKELKIAESAKSPEDLSEAQALKHWTADLWFFNWCSIDPPLAEFDLKPYFYFTRTSLDEKISRVSSILSPEALSILNKLASRAETNIDSAIRSSKKISDSEASLIHQSLFEKMLSSTEIDLGQFRAFLKYSSSKPLLSSDTMNCLSQLSGNQVPIPIVGELVAFANEHNMVENLREIADSWGKTNGRLKIALNAALNYGGIE